MRSRETQSRGISPATATVRTCQLEGCDELLTGRQRAYCSDAHRNKAFKQARREAERTPITKKTDLKQPKRRRVAVVATAPAIAGYRTPRYRLIPDHDGTKALEAIELVQRAGYTFDGWQEDVLRAAMGIQEGSWAASEVVLVVPRQNGKTLVTVARALWGAILGGEKLIVFTSHEVKTNNEAFRLARDIAESPAFEQYGPRIYRANGRESIEFANGNRIVFIARSRHSGRGLSPNLVICDEAMVLNDEDFATLKPSLSAAEAPQLWLVSSAPHPDSDVLRRYCIRGRAGEDERLCFFEWSAPDDAAPDSIEAAIQANPALGIRITLETVASELKALQPADFKRERLGIWAEEDVSSVFPIGLWASLATDELPLPTSPTALGIDVSPTRDHSAICGAALLADGRPLIEVVEDREGVSWVVPRVQEIVAKHKPGHIVIDSAGQAGSLIAPLRNAGLTITVTDTAAMAAACGGFFDHVLESKLAHRDDPALNQAVAGAKQRLLGDRFAWARRTPGLNVAPLVAGSLAHYAVTTLTPAPKTYVWLPDETGHYRPFV